MNQQKYILPAEWEKQSGVQLTWPHADTDWKPYLTEITETFIQLAKAIATRETLVIATPHPDETRELLETSLPASIMHNIAIFHCDTNDTWARDHGAITLADSQSHSGFHLLDFQFNGWGKKFAAEKDNAITRTLHRKQVFNGKLTNHNDFVLEGGAIESDGKGTIMTTSFCLLAKNRNQPMTQDDIEKELIKRLCAERIIWINHGQLIGDDTDGHIDTIVRFAPDDTILYVGCDDEEDAQHEDFALLERQLRDLRTSDGKPYRLIKLPMPRPMFDGEDRLPATYANFLIINGAVIVPTYGQPNLDTQALSLIGKAFPAREIIGIDSSTIIRQHGSIHCLTMQYPSGSLAKPSSK